MMSCANDSGVFACPACGIKFDEVIEYGVKVECPEKDGGCGFRFRMVTWRKDDAGKKPE